MTTYAPLDILKPVGDGIWIVDSGPLHAAGAIPLLIRMTVIQLEDGGILLHSPTRYDPVLRQEIESLRPIRHIVAPTARTRVSSRTGRDASRTRSLGQPPA